MEKNVSCEKLGQDAPKRPNVNFIVVLAAKDDLWCSVRPTLNVGTEMVVDEATGAEVDNFDLAARVALDKDVFWL